MRILIIEDEFNLADAIASRLKSEQYVVDISTDGENGLDYALSGIYDLIILDVMLPKINGFNILKIIRKEKTNVKVIMLTAKDMIDDKINGFSIGADDYLTKPFHMEELVARINVQLRKTNDTIIKDYLETGDLRLNLKKIRLECISNNESIDIVRKELLLLEYLMQNPSQILSKEQIYDKVWGIDSEVESNNLEAYISFVRKKIKVIGANVQIKAVRGLGYKIEVNNEET